jgi:hypothetical protein
MNLPDCLAHLLIPTSKELKIAFMSHYFIQGRNLRWIGKRFNCNHNTVKMYLKGLLDYTFTNRIRMIAPPLKHTYHKTLRQRTKNLLRRHFIIYALVENPRRTVRCIALLMQRCTLPFAVKKSNISTLIMKMNIHCKWTIKRPKLTQNHIDRRLKWTNRMLQDHRILLPWVFTDEYSIEINPSRCYVYPIPGITPQEQIFQEYEKFPTKVMVWSAMEKG